MRAKMRFDLNSIQEFCVGNVEKFVFGVVILGFLFLAYQAVIGTETVPFSPEDMTSAAEQAKQHIQNTDVPSYMEQVGLEVRPYGEEAKAISFSSPA